MKARSVQLPGEVMQQVEELRVINGYTIPIVEVIRKAIADLYQKEKGSGNGEEN